MGIAVIVHQPDRIPVAGQPLLETPLPAAGRADIGLGDIGDALALEHLDRAVRARIVDHDQPIRGAPLGADTYTALLSFSNTEKAILAPDPLLTGNRYTNGEAATVNDLPLDRLRIRTLFTPDCPEVNATAWPSFASDARSR